MAINISQQPGSDTVVPAYNPIIIGCESDDATIVNVKLEPYVFGIQRETAYYPPKFGEADEFEIDASVFVRPFISFDFQTPNQGTAQMSTPNSVAQVSVYTTERLENGSTHLLEDGDTQHSYNFYALNAALQNGEAMSDYLLYTSDKKFLTHKPKGNQSLVRYGESEYLACATENYSQLDHVRLRTYNSTGSQIGTWTKSISQSYRFDLGVGPANLNAASWTTGAGTPIPNDQSVAYYAINVENLTNGLLSERRIYYMDYNCAPPYITRIHFLNRLGGVDSFSFYKNKTRSIKVSGTTYGYLDANNFIVTEPVIANAYNEFTVWSGLITRAQAEWLEELKTSVAIRLEVNGELIPIMAIDIQEETWVLDKRFAIMEFKYRLSHEVNIQNR